MHRVIRRVLDPLLPVEHFTRSDRRIVFVIWVAGVVQGFAQSQASASLPFTRAGLGLSEGEMSLLLGIARLAAFAALPLGWLGDHRGRERGKTASSHRSRLHELQCHGKPVEQKDSFRYPAPSG